MKRKRGTLEQWQELGNMSKEVNAKLVALCVVADQIMPKKSWRPLGKAQTGLQDFRSDAENEMFRQLGHAGGATISIFYGGTEGSYR